MSADIFATLRALLTDGIPPEPADEPSGGSCVLCGPCGGTEPPSHLDADEREYVYHERLGIADDLGMDTASGSVAELIAANEARRAADETPKIEIGALTT